MMLLKKVRSIHQVREVGQGELDADIFAATIYKVDPIHAQSSTVNDYPRFVYWI